MIDLFPTYTQLFSSQDINWWIGFTCDVFISWLDSLSDGTHSLQRIYLWASDLMLNFSKSLLMDEQTHILDGLAVSTFLGWTVPLSCILILNTIYFCLYIVAFSNLLKSRVNQELFKVMAILFFTMENGVLCCIMHICTIVGHPVFNECRTFAYCAVYMLLYILHSFTWVSML